MRVLPWVMNTTTRKHLEELVEETRTTVGDNKIVPVLEKFLKARRYYEENLDNPPNPNDRTSKELYNLYRDNYALREAKKYLKGLVSQ